MIIAGLDPGLSGALCLYRVPTGDVRIFDIPTFALSRNGKKKREVDAVGFAQLIGTNVNNMIGHAFIEQVGAMPNQGVSGVFAFGKAYGVLIGVLAARGVPMTFVSPRRWKAALGVPAAKDGARARASQLMPASAGLWPLVKNDGRAEAALIAYWGIKTLDAIATEQTVR
jgi:crossover junction endodeoxyribonuclease RuvC